MTMIDKAEALLPCPFCEGKAVAFSYITEGAVHCSDCYAAITRGHKHTSETGYAEAIAAWNRRALPPAKQEHVADSNARGVEVKPLVWVDSVANTPIGPYQIKRSGEKYRAVYFDRDYLRDEHGRLRDFFDEEDAQTAAQADYEARILAALAPTDAAQARPAWLSNCVVCGRIVDTREKDEGGDGHGCEYPEGWTCSSDCAEKLHPDPDWMKEGLTAPRRYMGQIMAECDCPRPVECEAAQKCLAETAQALSDIDTFVLENSNE